MAGPSSWESPCVVACVVAAPQMFGHVIGRPQPDHRPLRLRNWDLSLLASSLTRKLGGHVRKGHQRLAGILVKIAPVFFLCERRHANIGTVVDGDD